MRDYSKMTLKQLRVLPGYTSGSSCNMSLEQSIDSIYAELGELSRIYLDMTPAELCDYLRDLADDIEYQNIPEMRAIQEENHKASDWWN